MNILARLSNQWTDALFRERKVRPLAAFRIGWSLAMLMMIAHEWTRATLYQTRAFHVPLFEWIVPPSEGAFRDLLWLSTVGAVASLVGLLPRLGAAAVVSVFGYLLSCDLLLFRNHVYLGLLLGVLLACSPCGSVWSAEAMIYRSRHGVWPPASRSLPSVCLIQVQILVVYAWSVVNKLNGAYLSGYTLERELPFSLVRCPLSSWLVADQRTLLPWVLRLLDNRSVLAGGACAAMLIELALVLALPHRRTRPFAVVLGVALHLGIFCLMSVVTFGVLMVSSYVLFGSEVEQALHDAKRTL